MPFLGGLAFYVASAVALLGLPLLAYAFYRRYRATRRRSYAWLSSVVGLLSLASLAVPVASYARRDHLCATSGGWTPASEASRQLVLAAEKEPQSIRFGEYRLSNVKRDLPLWVREYELVITRPSGEQVAKRRTYWSAFSNASGLLWLGRPDSEVCNRRVNGEGLAFEHFASRVPK